MAQRKTARTARISSWDQSGLNEDAFVVQPGETAVLADLEGPGMITHLWFVQTCRRVLGPGLIPYSSSGVAMMEIHNTWASATKTVIPNTTARCSSACSGTIPRLPASSLRSATSSAWAPNGMQTNSLETQVPNLTG